jgi:hypothetical protein
MDQSNFFFKTLIFIHTVKSKNFKIRAKKFAFLSAFKVRQEKEKNTALMRRSKKILILCLAFRRPSFSAGQTMSFPLIFIKFLQQQNFVEGSI